LNNEIVADGREILGLKLHWTMTPSGYGRMSGMAIVGALVTS
jgi:hypothetical protein